MPISPIVLALAAAAFSFAGAPGASSVSITVQHGKIYQTTKPGALTQGFLQIHNTGDADTLTAATCPLADTTSLIGPDHQLVNNLAIPAQSDVALLANGPHLQLTGTHFSVQFGGIVPCSLTFKHAGVISVFLFAIPAP